MIRVSPRAKRLLCDRESSGGRDLGSPLGRESRRGAWGKGSGRRVVSCPSLSPGKPLSDLPAENRRKRLSLEDQVPDRLWLAVWPQEIDSASLNLPGRPSPVVSDGCVCSLNLRADPRVG